MSDIKKNVYLSTPLKHIKHYGVGEDLTAMYIAKMKYVFKQSYVDNLFAEKKEKRSITWTDNMLWLGGNYGLWGVLYSWISGFGICGAAQSSDQDA